VVCGNHRNLTLVVQPTMGRGPTHREKYLRLLGLEFFFEIERTAHRMSEHARAKIRCVGFHRREVEVYSTRLFLTPVTAVRQVVGEMLTGQRGNMRALGGECVVESGLNLRSNKSPALSVNSSWMSRRASKNG
jgi:hypothetical protein